MIHDHRASTPRRPTGPAGPRRGARPNIVDTYPPGPYYFADLLDADERTEQSEIDSGQLNPGCLRYAGRLVDGATPRRGDETDS